MLGPLVDTDLDSADSPSSVGWSARIGARLSALDARDSQRLYQAIRLAQPGGMGDAKQWDIRNAAPQQFLGAMRAASDRDRIAANYADQFADLFQCVVPLVSQSIEDQGDLLAGITHAHVRLLASSPDSLIGRKFGSAVASQVQRQAEIDPQDWHQVRSLDRDLRSNSTGILNPGTTADLIAAALYVLLRT